MNKIAAAVRLSPAGESDERVSTLYRLYWDELCIYLRRSFGAGPPEPEDVAQAAFARFAAVREQDAVANPRAFLYATARNIVVDHHRHQAHCDAHARDVMHTAAHDVLYEISPEHVLLERERARALIQALTRISPMRRKMILLHRIEGLNHAEIAKRFGISQSSVQKHIERGLIECSRHMDGGDE